MRNVYMGLFLACHYQLLACLYHEYQTSIAFQILLIDRASGLCAPGISILLGMIVWIFLNTLALDNTIYYLNYIVIPRVIALQICLYTEHCHFKIMASNFVFLITVSLVIVQL